MSSRLLRNGPRRFFHWSMCMTQLMNTYGTRTLTLARGEGSYVWDDQGKRYLDAISGIAVCGLGHAHPALAEALRDRKSTRLNSSHVAISYAVFCLKKKTLSNTYDLLLKKLA